MPSKHERVKPRVRRGQDAGARPLPHRLRTDEDLFERVASGDRQAMAILYERHARSLRRLAQKLLGSTDAEDVLQDVMLEVWQKAQTYDPARSPVLAWIVLRLRSRAVDRIRATRARRHADLSALDAAAFESALLSSEDDPDRRYLQLRVRRACARLSTDDLALLTDTYALGLTRPEVADQLAVLLGTVKSRLDRALRRLSREVGRPKRRKRSE